MKAYLPAVFWLTCGGLLSVALLAPWHLGEAQVGQPQPMPKELTSYRDLVKKVLPAVVSLDAKLKAKAKAGVDRDDDVELVQQPGEGPKPGEAPKAGFGSGVLIDQRGVILTSFHVVEGAESVVVTLLDGRQFIATDIRGDRKTDLAVVVLDAKKAPAFPFLNLGDSDAMEIGDRVLAVGAPFGLSGSVTHGIISGKGRTGLNLNFYEDFLQTDAAINPGNSGGPLISLDGKVIGINAAIKSKSGGFQGVGLAVASNLCRTVAQALLTDGVVRRGYLGLHVRELSPELAAKLGMSKSGVVVGEVFENTPAAKAGLKTGDVLLTLGGRAVTDTKTLQNVVLGLPLNRATTVTFLRDGKQYSASLTIVEQPEDFGATKGPR